MIHQYKLYGYNIVLDVYTGALHVVDDVAYDVIELYEKESRESIVARLKDKYKDTEGVSASDIDECYEQVCELVSMGKLYSKNSFESMAGTLKEKTGGVVKALCLHIAHTCNLNCSYCFASQGKYSGERAVMSFEVGKRALDFLI